MARPDIPRPEFIVSFSEESAPDRLYKNFMVLWRFLSDRLGVGDILANSFNTSGIVSIPVEDPALYRLSVSPNGDPGDQPITVSKGLQRFIVNSSATVTCDYLVFLSRGRTITPFIPGGQNPVGRLAIPKPIFVIDLAAPEAPRIVFENILNIWQFLTDHIDIGAATGNATTTLSVISSEDYRLLFVPTGDPPGDPGDEPPFATKSTGSFIIHDSGSVAYDYIVVRG